MFVAPSLCCPGSEREDADFLKCGQVQPILCSSEKPKTEYIDSEGDRFPLGIIEDCHYQKPMSHLNKETF